MVAIDPEDELYRRLASNHIRPDGSVNSAAFKTGDVYDTEISVDIAKLTNPQESVDRVGRAGFRLCRVKAKHPRSLGFTVAPDPLPNNRAHALLTGENNKTTSRALARHCEVIPGVTSRDQ